MFKPDKSWLVIVTVVLFLISLTSTQTELKVGAGASDPVINEFVFNHTGADTDAFIEIYGTTSTDYSTMTLLEIDGDTTSAGDVDAVIALGTTDGNGFIVDSEDVENGTVSLLLVEGFSGSLGADLDTNDDGTLESMPWTRVVDSIGVYDGGVGDHNYSGTVLVASFDGGSFTVGGASRIPNGTDTDSVGDWVRNDFEGAGLSSFPAVQADPGEAINTPGTVNQVQPEPDPVINEFVFNHTGTDTDAFVEIFGSGSTDYSALTLLEIEGDSGNTGLIDDVFTLSTSDANGYLVFNFDAENGTVSLLLVEGFTGALNDDIDANDDGAIDNTPWTRIVDSIGVSDGDGGDFNYSTPALTPGYDGGSFTVGGASRIPNGTDTDAAGDWIRNDFEGAGLPSFPAVVADPGEAINTPGNANEVQVIAPEVCGDPATLISTIQGTTDTSPEDGNVHSIEGVVVGDFQDTTTGLSGFYIQEEDSDADLDPTTSEGVFVYDPGFTTDVSEGELVRVRGTVGDFSGQTQLESIQFVAICVGNPAATPVNITLPVASISDLESVEGMAVNFTQTLYATDHFNVGRFGEVTLSVNDRLYIPTNVVEPGAPANALADLNLRSQILMDDGSSVEWPAAVPYLGADNTLRLGETTNGLTGVLTEGFGAYRVHPTAPVVFDPAGNPRASTPVPTVGGNLKVASFNVLNYFTTIDNGSNGARGADNATEFTRQQTKIVDALADLNADVVGLIEIENNSATAVSNLVNALNGVVGAGTYAYIDDPLVGLGSDAIKVAIIYKPAVVSAVGASQATLASPFDIRRPPLAQTFQHNASGEVFTFVVVHFKSKGCSGASGADTDQGDGQGCYNAERTQASATLKTWLGTDPTSSGDPDFLVMGDFNAYVNEDPIDEMLVGANYTSLLSDLPADEQYSYVFFGEAGALDNAFASTSLDSQVTGVGVWHINADEPRALDYNDDIVDAGESSGNTPENQPYLYQPDQYRSSDHDAIVVGLNFAVVNDLAASAVCVDENLIVSITAGDGPFNITASAGINTPVNGVGIGTVSIPGPEKWDDLKVTETAGDLESINLGQFKCRTDERPVPLTPPHRSRTTDPFPLFSWTAITNANNYRVFIFDDKSAITRTVDIRQNSGGTTSMMLSTPLPDGRLFWRTRGRQNRVWSLWSIRFTLFKDPAPLLDSNTPVPTLDLNPDTDGSTPVPVPTIDQPAPTEPPAPTVVPTIPSPPNSR